VSVTRTIRYLLIAAALSCGLSAIVLASVMEQAQSAVARITRHETAWGGANSRIELITLARHLAEVVASGGAEDQARARESLNLSYEIVVGRVEHLQTGIFGDFLRQTEERQHRYASLRDVVAQLREPIRRLPDPAAWREARDLIDEGLQLLTRIASEARAHSLTTAEEVRRDLDQKQALQNGLLGALLVSALLLIGLLEFQNRLLSRTRAAVEKSRDEYAQLATHDILTGLPNRSALAKDLQSLVQSSAATRTRFAAAVLDLDRFKPVNDVLGHAVGDSILKSVSERILRCLEPQDVASRVGGDEFVILMPNVRSAQAALAKMDAVLRTLDGPIDAGGHSLTIGASIGYALSTGETAEDERILHHADIALNRAKTSGRGTSVLFEPQMLEELRLRSRLERDLAAALRAGDVVPHYQLQVDAATGKPVGVEALARWLHPILGNVPPTQFIPVAEASGQISDLGMAILQAACRDAVRFPRTISVSVNVSAAQLMQEDFAQRVEQTLAEAGLSPTRLKIEITESGIMHDAARARAAIDRLNKVGVAVSLDDFGTGYSSLSYLREFGLQEIKIDRSFVKNLGEDPEGEAIIRAMVWLANSLRMVVVAEGVETAQQAAILERLGCDRLQGYYFGRPVRASDLRAEQLLGSSRSDSDISAVA
jgi:diguanylate cyclase (GGDEF)-like protein